MAAPVLQLSQTALVWYPGEPATSTICATNTGDGTLSLSATVQTGVTWLAASVSANQCVQFTINPARLSPGTHTASVTVSDPHAVDAPQVVTVTAMANGGDPVAIDQYVAPGSSFQTSFWTGATSFLNGPSITAHTDDGGNWLAINYYPGVTLGSFNSTAYVSLMPSANMTSGTYTGSVTEWNYVPRTIPVTMRVSTQPIAAPSVSQIQLRLAQGGPAAVYPFLPAITFTDSGLGTLQVQGVSASGVGVGASLTNGQVLVTVDPMSRGPGLYTDGLVTVACNGANCPVQIPISLEIVPQAAPTIAYRGVVDNAAYQPTAAPGDVCILMGEQLSLQAPATAPGFPLPTNLGGASVLVNNVFAPL